MASLRTRPDAEDRANQADEGGGGRYGGERPSPFSVGGEAFCDYAEGPFGPAMASASVTPGR